MLIYLHTVYGCFHNRMAELSGHNKTIRAAKSKIFSIWLFTEKVLYPLAYSNAWAYNRHFKTTWLLKICKINEQKNQSICRLWNLTILDKTVCSKHHQYLHFYRSLTSLFYSIKAKRERDREIRESKGFRDTMTEWETTNYQ